MQSNHVIWSLSPSKIPQKPCGTFYFIEQLNAMPTYPLSNSASVFFDDDQKRNVYFFSSSIWAKSRNIFMVVLGTIIYDVNLILKKNRRSDQIDEMIWKRCGYCSQVNLIFTLYFVPNKPNKSRQANIAVLVY